MASDDSDHQRIGVSNTLMHKKIKFYLQIQLGLRNGWNERACN